MIKWYNKNDVTEDILTNIFYENKFEGFNYSVLSSKLLLLHFKQLEEGLPEYLTGYIREYKCIYYNSDGSINKVESSYKYVISSLSFNDMLDNEISFKFDKLSDSIEWTYLDELL